MPSSSKPQTTPDSHPSLPPLALFPYPSVHSALWLPSGTVAAVSLPGPALLHPPTPKRLQQQPSTGTAASRLRRQTGCPPSWIPNSHCTSSSRRPLAAAQSNRAIASSQNHVDADYCYCYSATPFSLSQPPSSLPILLHQLVDLVPFRREPTPAPDEPCRSLISHLHVELRPFHQHAGVLVHREWVVFLKWLFSSPTTPTRPGAACHTRAQQLHHHARLQGSADQRLTRLAKEETTQPRRLEQVLRWPTPEGDHCH